MISQCFAQPPPPDNRMHLGHPKMILILRANLLKRDPFFVSVHRNNITIPAIKGCVRNVKLNNKFMTYVEVVGVSRGCPKDLLVRNWSRIAIPNVANVVTLYSPCITMCPFCRPFVMQSLTWGAP